MANLTTEQVLKNTQDLLNRVKTEGVTDASGNKISNTATISADMLGTTNNQASLPTTPTDTNTSLYSQILAGNTTSTNKTTTEDPYAQFKDYLGSLEKPVDTSGILTGLENQYDITGKEQAVIESASKVKSSQTELDLINAQLKQITDATTAQNLSLENQGAAITTGGVSKSQTANLREAAIQSLPYQAQALVAQAKITSAQGDETLAQNVLTQAQNKVDTYYKIQTDYETSQLNYRNQLRESIYNFATTEQQKKLDAQKTTDANNFTLLVNNMNNAKTVANSLLQTQPDLSAKIMNIDWKSSTAQEEYSNLLSQAKEDPMTALDIAVKQAQLVKLQKETSLLGEPTAAEKKATESAIKSAKASIPAMQDKITAVDVLKNSSALSERVGPNIFSRKLTGVLGNLQVNPQDWGGAGQEFAGGVHKLVSGLTLDSLIQAKAQGATFGALSDSELNILANSASTINDWEIKKNGVGTGVWNVSETAFKKELDNIKNLTNRAILLSQGTLINDEEQSLLDNLFTNQDASSFYK